MKRVGGGKAWLLEEKRLIAENREEICKSNYKLFTTLMKFGLIVCVVLLAIAFTVPSYAFLRLGYAILFVMIGLFLLLLHYLPLARTTPLLYYALFALCIAYATYTSAFVTPDYIGVTLLVYLILIPVMIIDNSLRMTLYELCAVLLYLAIVVPHKDARLVGDEIINAAIFMLIGSASGFIYRRVRLQNIDLSRRLDEERTTDVLTGLHNRRKLFEFFKACEADPAFSRVYALAIIDIDDFKQLNDSYGHVAGDHCLEQIGQCFRSFGKARSVDFYRYGGEEFVAIAHEAPSGTLTAFFEGLNEAVETLRIPHESQPMGIMTVSIGVIGIDPDGGPARFEQLLDCADQALYEVKRSGKGQTLEYDGHENASPSANRPHADSLSAGNYRKRP